MALTEVELKQKIASELGLPSDPDLIEQIDLSWEQYEAQAYVGPNVRYFYVKRDAIIWLQGQNWKKFNWVDQGVVQSDSQRFDHLTALLEQTNAEIMRLETKARSRRPAVVGEIANQAVYTNPNGYPDPNSRAYRGDPLVGRGRNTRRWT